MAPFRHVPAHPHWFEVIVDKILKEDTSSKSWAVYVTQISSTFLENKVVEKDVF